VNIPARVGSLAAVRDGGPSAGTGSPKARGRSRKLAVCGLLALTLSGLGAGVLAWIDSASRRRPEATSVLPRRLVSRVDLSTKLTASGRVESAHKTVIQCELERLEVSNEGRGMSAGGASTVLEVVPEGTTVKKGDLLCRLDSSDYEELVRTQTMKTEQSRAALDQATLNFQVAELAVEEYRDGLVKQNTESLEGQIALGQAQLERATNRLLWTEKMIAKGYAPRSQKANDERSLAKIRQSLMETRWDLSNLLEFGLPKMMKELLSEVEKRRYEVIANTQRVTRLRERLEHYRKMVERCIIRAPHDGFVIYSVSPWRQSAPRLEPGVQVRQQQDLFYLPDLGQMEVVTYLHESVASRVHAGLPALVKVEGLENRELPGKVVSLGPLPVTSPSWTISEEVKYITAIVRLDSVPKGLLPGMSAEVEIEVDRSPDVLAIPAESVAFERGHDICYVAGTDGLERRQITLGRSNTDLLEVTRGLAEGESVIMNPNRVDSIDSLVVSSSSEDPTADTPAAGSAPITVQ